jgi:Anti-sigma factor NepR
MAEQDPAKRRQPSAMKSHDTTDTSPVAATPDSGVILDADLQAHIGRQLRAVYEEVVNEAVPDRLLMLLQELEREKTERS